MALSLEPGLLSMAQTISKRSAISQAACGHKVSAFWVPLNWGSHLFRPTSGLELLQFFVKFLIFSSNCFFPLLPTHSFKLLWALSKKSSPPSKVKKSPLLRLLRGKYCEIWSNFPRRTRQLFWASTAELKHAHDLPQGTLWEGPFLGTCSPCSGNIIGWCRS